MTLILLAGLQSRPGDVLEAANVDGANPWQIFRYITMPHMRQLSGARRPARLDLRHADLRRRLHHHRRLHWAPRTCLTPSTKPSTARRTTVLPPRKAWSW